MRCLVHPAPVETRLASRPDPVPGPGEIVVRVHASGLNRADLLQRAGRYPAPPGWPHDIPGLEYAGEVIASGHGATRWRVGDRVMGLVGGGAHAEQVVVHEAEAMPIPDGMSWSDAAAIPEAFLTAWDALVLRGRAVRGERVLMHAIGSGVGTAVVQLAAWLGLELVGTSRTPDKLQRAATLGPLQGICTTDPAWPEQVGAPVDVLVDVLGGDSFATNLALLAPRGRLVVLGTMRGGVAREVDLGRVLRQRLEIIGSAMRVREAEERRALVARFTLEVLPAIADGTLRPVVDRTVPVERWEEAYAVLASNNTFGKVVVQWG